MAEAPKKAKLPRIRSKEQIRQAKDIREEEVDVPEWGGSLLMRGLTVNERRRCRSMAREVGDDEKVEIDDSKLAMLGVITGMKEPQMDEVDIKILEEKASGVVQRLFGKVLVLSGFSEPQEKKDAAKRKPEDGPPGDADFTPPPSSGSPTPSTP